MVSIHWGNSKSKRIRICKGTRQGGLSSPFLFNIFYQDVVKHLSLMQCGCRIDDMSFNCFCYADDLLLTSTTVSGLQKLIDYANYYITSHGLRFNASKTECIVIGKPKFSCSVFLNSTPLQIVNKIT